MVKRTYESIHEKMQKDSEEVSRMTIEIVDTVRKYLQDENLKGTVTMFRVRNTRVNFTHEKFRRLAVSVPNCDDDERLRLLHENFQRKTGKPLKCSDYHVRFFGSDGRYKPQVHTGY